MYQCSTKDGLPAEARSLRALRTPQDRALFGRLLVEVPERRTFGELAYTEGEGAAARKATVIAGPPPKGKAKPGKILLIKV